MQNSYWRKNYTMTVQEASDALNLSKLSDSDWCSLTMRTNDFDNGSITIRSQAMAEQLHFMLGQMLSSNVELTGAVGVRVELAVRALVDKREER